MSRYTIHPMEQNFQDWDRERREKRDQYWQSLYYMRQEYLAEHTGNYDLTSRPTMHYWAEEKYGFKMVCRQKTAQLAMFKLTSPDISKNDMDIDSYIWKQMNRKGKGGCIECFVEYKGITEYS